MAQKFELFRDELGEYRWRLVGTDGHIIFDSQVGYLNKADAIKSIEAIKRFAADEKVGKDEERRYAATAPIVELTNEIKGIRNKLDDLGLLQRASLTWYWRLLAIVVSISSIVAAIFQMLSYLAPIGR